MLSDHEQKTLQELELRLAAQDPDFPRSFDARAQRLGHLRLGGSIAASVGIATSAVACVLMVVVGTPGGALALATVTGLPCLAHRWRWSAVGPESPPAGGATT